MQQSFFYCRSYCLLNMFRASLCPSSGVQEYYTVVAACGISCCKNVKNNFVSFCGICVLTNSTKTYKTIFYIFTMPIIRSSRVLYSGFCLCISCCKNVKNNFVSFCGICVKFHKNLQNYFLHFYYAHHQELKSIIQWFLPVVFRALKM